MLNANWKKCLVGVGLALTFCLSGAATSGTAPELFSLDPAQDRAQLQKTAKGYLSTLLAEPANIEVNLVKVVPALVSAQTQNIAVRMPDGKTAQFQLRSFGTITTGIDGWVGYKASEWKQNQAIKTEAEIDYDPMYYLSLVREGDKLVGRIVVNGQPYRLEYVSPGQHALIKVDESRLPPEGEPLEIVGASAADDTVAKKPQSAHSTIRVLLVTTKQLRAKVPNNRAQMSQALQDANQYFINSKIDVTYELAGFFDANFDETGQDSTAQVNALKNPNDPLGKSVLAQQETLRAAIVSMYSTVSNVCGQSVYGPNKENMYSIFSCAFVLSHEIGHNWGGRDGWVATPPEGRYYYGFKRTSPPEFHTRMVTSNGALPNFSNPHVQYQGVAMGTVQHDMARRINESREAVEAYYPGSSD